MNLHAHKLAVSRSINAVRFLIPIQIRSETVFLRCYAVYKDSFFPPKRNWLYVS